MKLNHHIRYGLKYTSASNNTIDIFLDWSHVKDMAQSFVAFGAHSVYHHILKNVPIETASEEITASKKIIEENAGLKTKIFCYPNGQPSDYGEREINIIKKNNLIGAVSTIHAQAKANSPIEIV